MKLTATVFVLVSLTYKLEAGLPARQQSNPDSSASCTYVFNVEGDSQHCHTADTVEVDLLKNTVANQQSTLSLLSQNIIELKAENEVLQKQVKNLTEDNNNENNSQDNVETGTTYIRWGAPTCPTTATLLYDGYTGKSYYTHGGGVNYLCLPRKPEFLPNVHQGHQSNSRVYGTEYETRNSPILPANRHDHNVPCAVCEVTGRTRVLLLPAKRSCLHGWTLEYEGYLMSQHHSQKASTFECADKVLQPLAGGMTDQDGGLFYMVEATCGSLPCPPYVDGNELTCVVCTK